MRPGMMAFIESALMTDVLLEGYGERYAGDRVGVGTLMTAAES
jgi:hypothetical protein